MPVIVVGADVPGGKAVVAELAERDGEVRAFVTDPAAAGPLRRLGVKVAVGDVSDIGHVQAAMTGCFCAVMMDHAARDDRERFFAAGPDVVVAGWRTALGDAAVHRAIWVAVAEVPAATPEHAMIDPGHPDLAQRVSLLNESASLDP